MQRTRVRFPAGRPWSCIFRNWSWLGSYNVYLNDPRIFYTLLWLSSIDSECKCQILLLMHRRPRIQNITVDDMTYFVTRSNHARSHRILFTLKIWAVPSVIRDFRIKIWSFSKAHALLLWSTALKPIWVFFGLTQRALVFYCYSLTSKFYPISASEVSDTIIHITHNDKQTSTWRGYTIFEHKSTKKDNKKWGL